MPAPCFTMRTPPSCGGGRRSTSLVRWRRPFVSHAQRARRYFASSTARWPSSNAGDWCTCLEQCPPTRCHDDPALTPAFGALLPTVGSRPVEGAANPDRFAVDVGPAHGARLAPTGAGRDRQRKQHAPALVAFCPPGQECPYLAASRYPELGPTQRRRLCPFGRVPIEPPPADGLAQCGGEHRLVTTDAGWLEGTAPALAPRQLLVPLVEVPGHQLSDRDVAELGEDGRFGRAPGVVEGPRGTASCLTAAEPFFGQGSDGHRRVRGDPVVVQFLLPGSQGCPGFGLVLGLDGLGSLPRVSGNRIGADEDALSAGLAAEPTLYPWVVSKAWSVVRRSHAGYGLNLGQRGKERCESGRIGLTANELTWVTGSEGSNPSLSAPGSGGRWQSAIVPGEPVDTARASGPTTRHIGGVAGVRSVVRSRGSVFPRDPGMSEEPGRLRQARGIPRRERL